MNKFVSQKTAEEIEQYAKKPYAAVLVTAPWGSGKRQVVEQMLDKVLSSVRSVERETCTRVIDPKGNTIPIDEVRSVKSWLKLSNNSTVNYRVVVVHDMDRMTVEAQNALLKMLEDTPKQTLFILTCSNTNTVIDTVVSRTQEMAITQPTLDESIAVFENPETDVRKAYLMTGGRLRLMEEVLKNEDSEYVKTIHHAKNLVASSVFERLCQVDIIIKEYSLELYIFALKTIYRNLAAKASSKKQLLKRTAVLRLLIEAEDSLARTNPNTKLLLTNLVINM